QKYHLSGEITLQELMAKDEIVMIEEEEASDHELVALVLETIEAACKQLMQMREAEGESLQRDITENLAKIKFHVDGLKELSPLVVQSYSNRLKKRMQEFLQGQVD